MVKLVAFYEDQWMPPGTDRAQYQCVALAFGASFQLVREWSEAEIPEGADVVVVDEGGETESRAFRHPENAVYVFGRSGQSLMGIPHAASVRVETPLRKSLFGISAASIILRDRG